MRTHCLLFAFAALLILPAAGTPLAQAVDAKSAKKLVEEYCKPATASDRRASLQLTLLDAANADLATALKGCMRKEAERPAAMELALALHVRGLFSAVQKHLEANPAQVAALGLISGDKGAAVDIAKKWKDADPESELYAALTTALKTWGADLPAIEEIRKAIVVPAASEKHKADGLAILKFQTGFDAADTTEVEGKWAAFIKPLANEFKRYPLSGIDLAQQQGWTGKDYTRRGQNIRVEDGGFAQLEAAPIGFTRGTFNLTFWVWFGSKEPQAQVGFRGTASDGKSFWSGAAAEKGNWFIYLDGGNKEMPLKPDTWHEVSIKLQCKPADNSTSLEINIGGVNLIKGISVPFLPSGIHLRSIAGPMVVAGADYHRH